MAWLQKSTFHLNSLLLMVILMWAQVGFSMVLLSAAVKGVPVDTLEAARIDGAGERQIFFRVVVPQIKGTIITVFITVTISVMKIFDIVYVNTNGNFNTNVLGNEFWNQISTYFNYGAASAIVVILMIAVIPIMWYQVRHFKAEEAGMTNTTTTPARRDAGRRERAPGGRRHFDANPAKAGWLTKTVLADPVRAVDGPPARHLRHVVPRRSTTSTAAAGGRSSPPVDVCRT